MKRIVILLILILLTISAQSDLSSSVNVKQIVQQQIEEAKKKEMASSTEKQTSIELVEKESQESKKKEKVVLKSVQPKRIVESKQKSANLWNMVTENMDIVKYGVLGFFSVLVMSFVAIRRSKLSKKQIPKDDFKANLKLVREEKFIKPIDPDLKKIRTNLTLTSKYLNTSEQYVTATAKKYNLAKTEIMLAAKFRNQSAIYN